MSVKIGQTVAVSTSAGLRARTGPNGKQVTSKGRALVRPRGFRFKVRDRRSAGGQHWVRAKTHWYAEKFVKVAGAAAAAPTGRVSSPCPGYRVTTPWGRRPPAGASHWRARGRHTGDDYAAPTGARVVAVRAGNVVYRWDSTLGHCALLQGTDGQGRKRTWWYSHLRARPTTGRVSAGQTIGHVGATGSGARGPHLHFEVRAGHTTSWAGADFKPAW